MASNFTADQLIGALFALGFTEPDDEDMQHLEVLLDAFVQFHNKNRTYGGAWRKLGALNNLLRMATKVNRLLEMYWHNEYNRKDPDLDDAYDTINYAVFFMRQAKIKEWTRG